MAPYDIIAVSGKLLGYLVYLLIGVGFGAVLEMSGFGDSRVLSAQFYFKDMTVLKVMFTAIIVAMVLIFAFSSLGLLDFNRVYVNPTYLVPGIIGGIIMGFGFIIGGFCPGTSIVALATFKVDGFFFVGGVAFGAFIFGETLSISQVFYNSTYMGRFILPELFGISAGVVVVLVVLMALTMFYGAELAEKFFGEKIPWKDIRKRPTSTGKIIASAALMFAALFVLVSGQPTVEEKWNWIKDAEEKKLENREVYIHPGELLETMNDPMLYSMLLDIRSETDYNLFHLENARNITFADIHKDPLIKELAQAPANTVVVVMSNNETDATRAYKLLRAQGVLNLYILSGGVNQWLKFFPLNAAIARPVDPEAPGVGGDEQLNYIFTRAVGATPKAANPGEEGLKELAAVYTKKIKIQKKKVIAGGCG
ncbi:MAG: rhodanese-like domain-containing protein [Candidatus Aminicenantes bacterium]|nr:rhodanese-like domain-containing protein [Candidatus Aminicenantes bacterium]